MGQSWPLAVEAHNLVALYDGKPVPKARVDTIVTQVQKQAAQRNLVHELLDKALDKGWGDNIMLRSPTRSLSYRQARAEVDRRVGVLRHSLGLEPGMRVLLRGGNSIEMALAWLAVVKAGLVAVATMPLLRAKELGEIIAKAQPVLALCDASLLTELQQAQSLHPVLATIVPFNDEANPQSLGALAAHQPDHCAPCDTAADDIALLVFTSGTTGAPKGTMAMHINALGCARNTAFGEYRIKGDE